MLLTINRFVPLYILQADGSRVSSVCKDGALVSAPFGECKTLVECFLRGLSVSPAAGRCLGWRPGPNQPFSWITYQDVFQRAKNFGAGTKTCVGCEHVAEVVKVVGVCGF